jgi:hypothetical protein
MDRQGGLSDSCGAVYNSDHNRAVARVVVIIWKQRVQFGHVAVTPREPTDVRRQLTGWQLIRHNVGRDRELFTPPLGAILAGLGRVRVGDEDLLVELAKFARRFDPESVVQEIVEIVVRLQGFALSAAAVQGRHQESPRSFP